MSRVQPDAGLGIDGTTLTLSSKNNIISQFKVGKVLYLNAQYTLAAFPRATQNLYTHDIITRKFMYLWNKKT